MTETATTRRRIIVFVLLAVAAVVAAAVFLHYVPFEATSFAAWGGVVVALVGLVCLVKPLRFLGIRSRARGLVVLALGLVMTVTAVFWPTQAPHL